MSFHRENVAPLPPSPGILRSNTHTTTVEDYYSDYDSDPEEAAVVNKGKRRVRRSGTDSQKEEEKKGEYEEIDGNVEQSKAPLPNSKSPNSSAASASGSHPIAEGTQDATQDATQAQDITPVTITGPAAREYLSEVAQGESSGHNNGPRTQRETANVRTRQRSHERRRSNDEFGLLDPQRTRTSRQRSRHRHSSHTTGTAPPPALPGIAITADNTPRPVHQSYSGDYLFEPGAPLPYQYQAPSNWYAHQGLPQWYSSQDPPQRGPHQGLPPWSLPQSLLQWDPSGSQPLPQDPNRGYPPPLSFAPPPIAPAPPPIAPAPAGGYEFKYRVHVDPEPDYSTNPSADAREAYDFNYVVRIEPDAYGYSSKVSRYPEQTTQPPTRSREYRPRAVGFSQDGNRTYEYDNHEIIHKAPQSVPLATAGVRSFGDAVDDYLEGDRAPPSGPVVILSNPSSKRTKEHATGHNRPPSTKIMGALKPTVDRVNSMKPGTSGKVLDVVDSYIEGRRPSTEYSSNTAPTSGTTGSERDSSEQSHALNSTLAYPNSSGHHRKLPEAPATTHREKRWTIIHFFLEKNGKTLASQRTTMYPIGGWTDMDLIKYFKEEYSSTRKWNTMETLGFVYLLYFDDEGRLLLKEPIMDYNGPQSTIRFTRYLRHPPLQRRKWTLKLDEIAKRACAEDGWLVVQGMEVLDKRLVVDIVHLMRVFALLLLSIFFSAAAGVVYTVLTRDAGGGFTIASYVVTCLSLILAYEAFTVAAGLEAINNQDATSEQMEMLENGQLADKHFMRNIYGQGYIPMRTRSKSM